MNVDVYGEILAAFSDGRKNEVMRLIDRLGENAIGDPLLIQIMALSRNKRLDEQTLLQSAAYDCRMPDPQALFNLGVCEQEQGNTARALLSYSQTLRLEPSHSGALNNYSDLLRRQHRSAEAWQAISSFLETGADSDGLELRIAKIADDCDRPEDAEAWFKIAAAKDPNNRQIAWEWAMQLLRDEKFAAGWEGYEARKAIFPHDALAIVRYNAEEWDGNSLEGKTLLVHKEQGLGDTIMFASCLPVVLARAGHLHLAVQPELARLFKESFGGASVWASRSQPGKESEEHQSWRNLAGHIDCQAPFGSLPLHLRSRRKFLKPKPYLRPMKKDVAIWRERLVALAPNKAGALRAGLVITARRDGASGSGIAEGLPKCVPARLAGSLAQPAIAWYGLHDLSTACDLAEVPKLDVVDTSPWLYDLADTAALIANLDVVVAVDTAVAHLAGALGKKVLLMLRRHADWRWGRSRKDSYWYPDIEVFRQAEEGVWYPVVADVGRRLAELAGDRRNAIVSPKAGAHA